MIPDSSYLIFLIVDATEQWELQTNEFGLEKRKSLLSSFPYLFLI